MLPVVRQLLTALRHKCPPSQPHGHQLNAESRPASALRPNNMTRTRRPIALFLMLSSLHWLGESTCISFESNYSTNLWFTMREHF